MFKKIPGNNHYRIDLEKIIIDLNGDRVVTNGVDFELELFGKVRKVSLGWLSLYSWFEFGCMDEASRLVNNLNFFVVESNILRITSKHTPCFKVPIYYAPGFRIIPAFPRYAISVEGIIIDTLKNTLVEWDAVTPSSQYPTAYIYNPDRNGFRTTAVHRLKMFAWKPSENYTLKHYINHIDGDKTNHALSNLEWCDLTENARHATHAGLIDSAIAVKVRDVYTGEVKTYPSLSELGRGIGIGSKDLSGFQNKLPGWLYMKRYEIKAGNDDTPWYYTDLFDIDEKVTGLKAIYTIIVESKITGEREIFNNLRKLRIRYGIGISENNISAVVREIELRYPDLLVTYQKNSVYGPYRVINIIDNSETIYNSMVDAAKAVGLTRTELQYDLCRDRKYIYNSNWIVVPRDSEYVIENYVIKKSKELKVMAIYADKSPSKIFPTLKAAAEFYGINKKTVRSMIQNNKVFKGVQFRVVDPK